MGGSSSKVGRTLPTTVKTPRSGAKGNESPLRPRPVSRSGPLASETRDQDIDRDGKDPQLLNNLGRIGQVNVQSVPMAMTRKANPVSEVYRSRHLAEQQAASVKPVRNRLLAGSLSNMLDDRKLAASSSDLERLAARYNTDVSVLERLARFVNSPSIGEGTVVRTVGENGQEKITMQAVWTDPDLRDVLNRP